MSELTTQEKIEVWERVLSKIGIEELFGICATARYHLSLDGRDLDSIHNPELRHLNAT